MTDERKLRIALNSLRPLDREILTLRHFEQLSTAQLAETLEITPVIAGRLYIRAMKQLTERLRILSDGDSSLQLGMDFQPFSSATTALI